ncbi:MAG: beta-N-acetylhexosaminidase [Anaerolineae bacterium]
MDERPAPNSALPHPDAALLPYPQEIEFRGAALEVSDRLSLVLYTGATESDWFAARDLAARLALEGADVSVVTRPPEAGPYVLLTRSHTDLPDGLGEQGYRLTVDSSSVTVAAIGEAGLFYGTRTLLQLLQSAEGGRSVPGVEILDWPDIPYRAAHYDTKHHQDKAEYVQKFIRDLADYKINMLVWEWEDKFAYRSHPEIGAPGAFTIEEMQAFTEYARRYHVQLVPLVQGLGHASYILKWPAHAHLREIPASNWEFCPLKDGTYDLLLDLWDEAIEATPGSEFIHIGTDETYELGLGEACGCKAMAGEIGRRGLLLHFLDRCVRHLETSGRRVMCWGGEYLPGAAEQPPVGLIVAEFTEDLELAKASRDAGYPAWVYDPNPGIEHLFLPYFRRLKRDQVVENCLQASHDRLASAAPSGFYEGMINTSWDDSGLHNQVWMMSFANSAEWAWSGRAPNLDAFIDDFFGTYYGPAAQDMRELWLLLNEGAYFYMDAFERKVWHWGDVGKTHLPDLPRGDTVEYDPYWNREYANMVDRARDQRERMRRAIEICQANLSRDVRNAYDFGVFTSIARLIDHTAATYLALSELEDAITEAHKQHFLSYRASYDAMLRGIDIIATNIAEREDVFRNLVDVWGRTRLPKGLSLPDKPFFHGQDRARHFGNRQPDMSYLIYDEQLLDLEGYLTQLRAYASWYESTYVRPFHTV